MKIKSCILFCFLAQTIFAQIEFSLELDKFGVTYTVFAKPDKALKLSKKILASTAQVTLITQNGVELAHFKSLGGEWDGGSSIVREPIEDANHDYISVGMIGDNKPKLTFQQGKPTALFSFETVDGCQGAMRLIDNQKDIFAKTPNSANNNPGNDLSAIDIVGMKRLFYTGNYEPFKVVCPSEHLSPFSTILKPFNAIYATVELEKAKDVESYEIQARLKGTKEWLTPVDFKETKLYFYGHLDQIYEYQVKTIFKDGREDWGRISEITRVETGQEEKYLKP